jgi:cation diffusion facilitator CzcD-associated flavoprotein CzcO
MSSSSVHVAVVGAGPYGLAVGAHLRAVGIDALVFGVPMDYWERSMPSGMLLRSPWRASSISSPHERFSLAVYEREHGRALSRPVPREDFVAYGHWFQRRAVGEVDRRRVTAVRRDGDRFRLRLDDDDTVCAQRVVVATGLATFPWRPPPFDRLSSDLASHTADHNDLSRFAGRRVLVVGAGQSAVECAALVREAGGAVSMLNRAPVHWLTRSARLHGNGSAVGRALYAPEDVGPAGLSWVVAVPGLVRRTPDRLRGRMTRRCLQPAASDWLVPRVEGVPMLTGHAVRAEPAGAEGVRVTLENGRVLSADHVLLGTGFRPDIARVELLSPELAGSLRAVGGQPVLGPGFESSVPGLHLVGALAAYSFGPVVRFVSGTWYTAPVLVDAVLRADGRVPRHHRSLAVPGGAVRAVE